MKLLDDFELVVDHGGTENVMLVCRICLRHRTRIDPEVWHANRMEQDAGLTLAQCVEAAIGHRAICMVGITQ